MLEVADSRTAREGEVKVEGGGEVVEEEDVWECLFGSASFRRKMERRDLEFREREGANGHGGGEVGEEMEVDG